MAFDVVSLKLLLDQYDEHKIIEILKEFESPNSDVEFFLRSKAISFEKVGMARTTLVFSSFKGEQVLVGYYSISNKPLSIGKKNWNKLSKSSQRKLMPMGYKSELDNYVIQSILLGQFSKNFKYRENKLISGQELLSIAYESIKEVWELSGGTMLYLEAENEPHVRNFYVQNGFNQLLIKDNQESKKPTVPYETVNNLQLYIKKLDDI